MLRRKPPKAKVKPVYRWHFMTADGLECIEERDSSPVNRYDRMIRRSPAGPGLGVPPTRLMIFPVRSYQLVRMEKMRQPDYPKNEPVYYDCYLEEIYNFRGKV